MHCRKGYAIAIAAEHRRRPSEKVSTVQWGIQLRQSVNVVFQDELNDAEVS